MTNNALKELLDACGACEEAANWVGDKTGEQAFAECPNPFWFMWALQFHGPPFPREILMRNARNMYGSGLETYQARCDWIRRQPEVREAFKAMGVNVDG